MKIEGDASICGRSLGATGPMPREVLSKLFFAHGADCD
jgi:hypothetical protein